jgi:hypothetical protein
MVGKSNEATSGLVRSGLKSLIILGAWILWNHRNHCVFDGITLSVSQALVLAGARGISFLTAHLPRT